MDQLMVDVTDIDVKRDDEVIFIGKSGDKEITIEEIANNIGEISESTLCMFSKGLPRVYIKEGEAIKVKDYLLEL